MPIVLDLKSKFQRTLEKSKKISGRLICRQLTYIVDSSILSVYNQLSKELQDDKNNFCIIAIGGYGRMELAPFSDIDILYLHNGLSDETLSKIISRINTGLYDSGKEVGHSCRTIEECRTSLDTIETFYAFLDARFICGSEELYRLFETELLGDLPKDIVRDFNKSKLSHLEVLLNSEVPFLVTEPNLKTGKLCLRDIQTIYWIEKSINRIPSLSALSVIPSFTRGEVQQLESAYDFLLRTRIALHVLSNRKNDRLDLTMQSSVAEYLGFGPKDDLISTDKMMHELYTHQKEIYTFTGIYLDYKKISNKTDRKSFETEELSLEIINKSLFPPRIGNLFSNPETLYQDILNVFYISHKFNLTLSPTLLNELRFASNFLQEDFKNSRVAIEIFLSILNQSKHVGSILTSMHRANILGKLLPEFGACTNFPLFSYHHEYPVDEHSLYILRQLDLLLSDKFDDEEVQREFYLCKDIDILALSIIIHDAGKVKEGDHCQYGSEMANAIGERMGMTEESIELFKFLVEVHIHMSELTSKRDISDPELIRDFANLVRTEHRLRLLYILTVIDTKSVGPAVLTNWKKAILSNLFKSTLNYLRSKEHSLRFNTMELDRDMLKSYLVHKEKLDEIYIERILKFADEIVPNTYLRYNTPRRIVQQFLMAMTHRLNPEKFPVVEYEREPSYITIMVYSSEYKYLLSDISGTVTSEVLNLISLRSFKSSGGFTITLIQITDSFGGGDISEAKLERLKKNLVSVLKKESNVEKLLTSPAEWNFLNKIPDGMVDEKIEFHNEHSSEYTILEVRTLDSIGLLYRTIKTILSFDVQLHFVKVATSADFAYDSFYIKSDNGNKIEDNQLLKKMEEEIKLAASQRIKPALSYINF